jgi:hypothetical protein
MNSLSSPITPLQFSLKKKEEESDEEYYGIQTAKRSQPFNLQSEVPSKKRKGKMAMRN